MIVSAPATFQGVDFYELDAQLTDEERLIRDTVRRFVDDEVCPVIADHFENGTFPTDLIPRLAEMGIFGATLPTEYGCRSVNNSNRITPSE